MKHSSRGMTLIEVLVALTALSLLAAGMIAVLRVGHRTYDRILKFDRTYSEVVAAQRFLRRSIESAYPFQSDGASAGLIGTSDRLELTAPGGYADHFTGFRRVELALVRRDDGFENLMVTSRLDRNGLDSGSQSSRDSSGEVLVPRVKSIEWRYLAASREPAWQSTWTERRPPALVRLHIEFPTGDSRRWPDFVVAPQVTDDANCNFDVISRSCRDTSS